MAVLNYTTTIPAWKTVAEVEYLLMEHGATAVLKQFEDGRIAGLSFMVHVSGKQLPIKLPVHVPEVLEALRREKRAHPKKQIKLTLKQAEMVAWRQIRDWVEIQMQMIELGQMSMVQIFMSCIQGPTGETMYERLESNGFLLPGGEEN